MNFFRKFILIVENTPEKKPVTGKLGEAYSNIMGFIIPLKITDTPYLRVPISKTSNDLTSNRSIKLAVLIICGMCHFQLVSILSNLFNIYPTLFNKYAK